MVIIVSTIAFLSIVLLVNGVQDGMNWFAIWNLAPVIVVLGHLAWHFDWDETATGSSTSGLIFLLLPLPAFFFGLMVFSLGTLIPYFWREKKPKA